MKKLVVILTGGGARGAFQAGVLNRVMNEGFNFEGEKKKAEIPNAVFGVSAGALNGAMIAMGKDKELIKLWNGIAGRPEEIYTSQFLKTEGSKITLDTDALGQFLLSDMSAIQKVGLLFKDARKRTVQKLFEKLKSLTSIADNMPLLNKVRELVKIRDIKSEVFQAGFVSLTDGGYYSVNHTDFETDTQLQNAVLASSTMPLIWSPVEKVATKEFETSHLIDGGLRNINPLGDAVKYVNSKDDSDEYYFLVISTRAKTIETMQEQPNLLNVIQRSIYDIALNEIGDTDLSEFMRINQLVKQAKAHGLDLFSESGRKLKSFKFKIIEPMRELSSALNFSRSAVMDSFLHGYVTAKQIIESPNWG